MIATWCKLITVGNTQPAAEYCEEWKHSSKFEDFWLTEVPEETFVIGMPKPVWYTARGMYRRKDIRDVVSQVMELPMPRARGLVCCIWTRHEELMGSVTKMKALTESEAVRHEVMILWNWIGYITRQTTTVQRAGGLVKEFDAWMKRTDLVLPTTPNLPRLI